MACNTTFSNEFDLYDAAMATGTSAKHSLTKLSALRSMVSGKHHLVSAVGVSKVMPSVVALDGPEQPAQTPAGCKSALQLLEEDKDNFSILLSAIKVSIFMHVNVYICIPITRILYYI